VTERRGPVIGYVVRWGLKRKGGVYASIRLRVSLEQDPAGALRMKQPDPSVFHVMLSRERRFATMFPIDERACAEALASQYNARVVAVRARPRVARAEKAKT